MGFHVTNVLLHMLNVVLLFQLAWRFEKGRLLAAFAASTLLAVHPMMTEAVGYISGRSEVLCATFFMLAMMSGRRWLEGRSNDLRDRVSRQPGGAVALRSKWMPSGQVARELGRRRRSSSQARAGSSCACRSRQPRGPGVWSRR